MKGQRLYDSIAGIVGEDFCSDNYGLLGVVCSKICGSSDKESVLYNLVMSAYTLGHNHYGSSSFNPVVPNNCAVFVRNPVTGVGYDGTTDLIDKVYEYGRRVGRRLERESA